jgi:hypothetical protein
MHQQILKSHYCCYKLTELDVKSHVGLLDHVLFEQQSSFFMTTMQSDSEAAMTTHMIIIQPFEYGEGLLLV